MPENPNMSEEFKQLLKVKDNAYLGDFSSRIYSEYDF
jgi:hypothetical protein